MARILLIEKDSSLRNNWRELFKFLSHQVSTIESLENVKTVSQLTTRYFTGVDLVVADTDVVDLDGLKLKALFNNDFQRIPIVFISADYVPSYSLEREEYSAISFLRKPFDNALLLEFVNKAIKTKNLLELDADSNKTIAKIVITQPNHIPVEHVLRRSYSFGRFRTTDEFHADIQLTSPVASRKHAYLVRVFRDKESYYKLIDFSSNGILINGKRMEKIQRLNHQDVIQFYPKCEATFTEIEREQSDLDTTLTQGE